MSDQKQPQRGDGAPAKNTSTKIEVDDRTSETKDQDVVLVHGRTEDGEGLRALRARKQRVELAELRPTKAGKPMQGSELVRLRPREESPLLFDVDVQYAEGESTGHDGPARVSNRRYRDNYDAVFGKGSGRNGVLN